ncbi:hypothetical protein B188_23000 [Candidatus Brocadiaceae bacterium B188]|nr:hypothetical protein B188_23000 [Candidatus Brocadiaceae bacterium B188]
MPFAAFYSATGTVALPVNLTSEKRGGGCVTAELHTSISPLSKWESYNIKIPKLIRLGFKRQKPNDFLVIPNEYEEF